MLICLFSRKGQSLDFVLQILIFDGFELHLGVCGVADIWFNRADDIPLLMVVFVKEASTKDFWKIVEQEAQVVIANHMGQRPLQDVTEPGSCADFATLDKEEEENSEERQTG